MRGYGWMPGVTGLSEKEISQAEIAVYLEPIVVGSAATARALFPNRATLLKNSTAKTVLYVAADELSRFR